MIQCCSPSQTPFAICDYIDPICSKNLRISSTFVVQSVNFLRVPYASFQEVAFKKPNEMASENFPIAIAFNICKGFTA
jgi:hypothetical protein